MSDTENEAVEAVETENETAEAVDSDVEECLKRETHDGSGLENDDESLLPESDFDGEEEQA